MTSTGATSRVDIDSKDVEVTKWWMVYAAILYIIMSAISAVISVVVFQTPIQDSSLIFYSIIGVNLFMSAVGGYTIEYGRAKSRLIQGGEEP